MAEGSERKNPSTTGGSHKRVGSTVRGKYRVDAFLATGTMANVYAATHRNGARVALKILHKQLSEDATLCERFKREGYFANSIGHPGIVRAIDDDVTEDGCPFLVMELLEGETLEERRRRKGGRLPSSWVLPIADALLEILAAAHAREVVHRDLKPDNVFVTKSGEVKVLDFGVARWNDGQTSSDMTAVGMVLGTPAYMPPEQALGLRAEVDAQSDIWAVGATLFVVLSGESVHLGGDAKAKLIATARTAARPLREAAPQVPRSVAAVIDRALAFHKSERWPDADAMREALRWARLSLEERPSQASVSRAPGPEPIPPPGASPSYDFLTSAPPITLREPPPPTPRHASSAPHAPAFGIPASSQQSAPSSVDRSLSFTRPMAAMVMPADWPPAPRPAAGAPAASDGRTSALAAAAYATTLLDPRPETFPPAIAGSASAYPSTAPPPATSSPPIDFVSSREQPTVPPQRLQPSHSTSLRSQGEPGPMLSQLVKPSGRRFLWIGVPLALAFVALSAGFFALRARAASARARATASAPAVLAAPSAAGALSADPALRGGTAGAPGSNAAAAAPSAEPAPVVAATPSAPPPKRKKKKKPRSAKPAAPIEPAEPAPEATAAPPPAPADTTPKDAFPKKDTVDNGAN